MMNPVDIRAKLLAAKTGIKPHEPQLHEVKIEEDVKDFDEALSEISSKVEALMNIAPSSKVDALHQVSEQLNAMKHQAGESEMEDDEEGKAHEEGESDAEERAEHGLGSKENDDSY